MKISLCKVALNCVVAAIALAHVSAAWAQIRSFDIPAEEAGSSIPEFGRQAGLQIVAPGLKLRGITTSAVKGEMDVRDALKVILKGTGVSVASHDDRTIILASVVQTANQPTETADAVTERDGNLVVAQAAQPPRSGEPVSGAAVETVVVSSSRITASGFEAPTPTTVFSTADIAQTAKPNIFDALTQLPALQGSTGVQTGTGGVAAGTNGLSSFGLRGLGTIRSLTLIDGQRVVPAHVTGVNDVSQFPQLLIQRVDVVTGGASASYGSDAVGGVVNFVTNKNFNGFKANLQGATSNYNDEYSALAQFATGGSLLAGRGHFEVAGEFYHNDGVPAPDRPGGERANGRCCAYRTNLQNDSGAYNYSFSSIPQIVNGAIRTTTATSSTIVPCTTALNNCLPQNNLVALNAQPNTTSEYGLINSGPLAGLAFNADGSTLSPFVFGTALSPLYTVPNATGAAACGTTTCVGGDLTNTTIKTKAEDPITRSVLYARVSYDLTPDVTIYATLNWASVFSTNTPNATPLGAVSLACGNAAGGADYYLSAALNAACVSKGITSIQTGVSYDKFLNPKDAKLRQMRRYVIGTDGKFNAFGIDWAYEGYFQHGENDTSIHIRNVILTPRFNAAADVVAGPNGTIVCRSTVAQAGGCVPLNVVGGSSPSVAALAYVQPMAGPYALNVQRQEAGGITFNSSPFKDWAGDVAMALGFEYREEAYRVTSDPYGDGVTAINPNTVTYPADALLNASVGNNWKVGNFHRGSGNYHVVEGFLELGIPLLDSPEFGKVDGNIAGRATDYSTSGYVSTWKVGATWETPLPGFRVRALQSRDVRAPNLSELFAATVVANQFVTDRTLSATAPQIQIQNLTGGNPNLKPETAQTSEIGFVYQPDYVPGLNISADYYRVAIKGEVGNLSAQQQIDLCQLQNNTAFCSTFNLHGVIGTANPSYVAVIPFNLASVVSDGFDFEVAYRFDLQDWGIPGNLSLRGLATHVSKFITNSGVPGSAITESAGTASLPLWKVQTSQSWVGDSFSLNLTERFFSNGVTNPYGIVCDPGACPLSTLQHPTYSALAMSIPGNLFVDVGGTYTVSPGMQAYFKIDNVADRLPGPIGAVGDDPIGRVYRVGFRFNN